MYPIVKAIYSPENEIVRTRLLVNTESVISLLSELSYKS